MATSEIPVMDGFSVLTAGFCAALATIHGQQLVEIGDLVAGECVGFVYVSEGSGELRGHDFEIEFFEGGAVVKIDSKRFVLPKTEGA